MSEPEPMRGLGDAVAAGIKIATAGLVKPCDGCKRRKEWLNKNVPFRRKRPTAGKPKPGPVQWGEAKPIRKASPM